MILFEFSLYEQRNYYNELSAVADIENIQEVFTKIYDDSCVRAVATPNEYRNGLYRIIDEENFERTSNGQA